MTYPDPYYGQTPGTSYYGSSGGAKVDPVTIAATAGSALSSIFGGDQGMSGNVQKHLAREGLNKQGAQLAQQLSTKLATLPLADRAAYLLSQRLTPGVMGSSEFTPHDLFNPGASAATPSYAGPSASALSDANAAYKPGMGGFDPGVLRQALANLGSSSDQSYSTTAGAGTPWGDTALSTPLPTEKEVAAQKQAAVDAANKGKGFWDRFKTVTGGVK